MKYEAKWWSKLLGKLEQYLPVKFDYTGASSRSHPWQIRPVWHKDKKAKYGEWRGIIIAGAVNAIPPYVKMRYQEAPAEARERIRLAAVAENKPEPKPTDLVKIYLDEQAELKFNWRSIGSDGSPDSVSSNASSGAITGVFEKVPDFFKLKQVSLVIGQINDDIFKPFSPTSIRLALAKLFKSRLCFRLNFKISNHVNTTAE